MAFPTPQDRNKKKEGEETERREEMERRGEERKV
jgi:hypothetical protein